MRTASGGPARPVGTFCLVLHSHLPWVAGHGTWPVGEEWLHQAWSQSYGPVVDVLRDLADEGHQQVLTLGVTPVLAAMLDDPYCLAEHDQWLANWQRRAERLTAHDDDGMKELGRYEHRCATTALHRHESTWRDGGTPVLRSLAEAGTIEILGGPAAHPFQPLLPERVADFSLDVGLADHARRLGADAPRGIWAPECAYRPGLEELYQRHGVSHLMVDGPTLQHVGASTSRPWLLGDSDVTAFGRDLEVSYRVWSPRRGYPGGRWYRDFHTFDHTSGFKHARVTSRSTSPAQKQVYDPAAGQAAIAADVADFVEVVHNRLVEIEQRDGEPGLVVAAYDTELFGHWWHEGPQWLGEVLRALPAAGIRLRTLEGALADRPPDARVTPERGTWGRGKDFHVWDSPETADLVDLNARVCEEIMQAADRYAAQGQDAAPPAPGTAGAGTTTSSRQGGDGTVALDHVINDAAREALLALQSDWAFMVSHDSAGEYARSRAFGHAERMRTLLRGLDGRAAEFPRPEPLPSAYAHLRPGIPFPHLDARRLASRRERQGQPATG